MKRLAVPIVLLAALVVGCKAKTLAGTYSSTQGNLILSENGSFKTTGPNGAPSPSDMTGKWKEEKDKLELTTDTIGGKSVDAFSADLAKRMGGKAEMGAQIAAQMHKLNVTESEDKKTLTLSVGTVTMVFTKQEK